MQVEARIFPSPESISPRSGMHTAPTRKQVDRNRKNNFKKSVSDSLFSFFMAFSP